MAANNLRLPSVPFFFNRVFIIICFLVVSSCFDRSYRFTERGSCCFPDGCDLCMKKSYELLKRRTNMACSMVFMYLGICGITVGVFGAVVVRVGDDYGLFTKILQIKRVVEEAELKYLSDLGIAHWRCYGYGFYELYDPSTVMFFFRKKHMIDIGTGNNNKINCYGGCVDGRSYDGSD